MGYCLRKEILNLPAYKAGKPISEVKRELGLKQVIKLASNENPLGCSPSVKKVLMDLVNETQMYPDASNYELKSELASVLNVNAGNIFCSTGSDALIKVLASAFLNEGDEAIMAEVTFARYDSAVKLMGGRSIFVPMKDNALDIDAMVNCITDKTKIIWLCNPNNPTGTIFTASDLDRVFSRIPENVMVIMDEAYIEYVTNPEFPDSIKLMRNHPNVIILRTFSKAYGLAGLRVGYGIANEELVKYLNSVIGPFDVSLFAQKAAFAALKDKDFIKLVHDTNINGRDYLYAEFDKLNLPYIKTNTNFIMVNVKTDDETVFQELLKLGIIIRPGYLLGMKGWLRVTIGTQEQNEKFISALTKVLC
ncbi:histidinol-phosphate transaminase [Clostridium sp. JN-9]|uniref:histidinol-phosphate transaminase n=1 Tax=Clostridium sp. JN-9 TaxID=2507159 RepID=UPI000FFE020A|nr:histidinol-phosphate transaminase [Clostridium sp. JN-9]QAT41248.1 histidinol-phosphate transaminase [Clostridium sp. JN-9]